MFIKSIGRHRVLQKYSSAAAADQARYDDAQDRREAMRDNLRRYLDLMAGMNPPF